METTGLLVAALLALAQPSLPPVLPGDPLPAVQPSPVVSALTAPVDQLLTTVTPSPSAVTVPGGSLGGVIATPAPPVAGTQPGPAPAPVPSLGAPGSSSLAPVPAGTADPVAARDPEPGVACAVDWVVRSLLDTPLGPTPPIIGLLLIALSLVLAVHRRLRQRARDRALEEAKMHFLKVASHELRTPLTVIGGYISMAGDGSLGALPAPMRRALPTLHEEVDQLERLVEQMLLATRLDEGLLGLERRRLDLRAVAAAGVQAVAAGERRRLFLDLPDEPVHVAGDATALQLVVRNLVENALKYSPDDREVRLTVSEDWRRARISVSDRGIGIGRSDLGVLFTRFGRIVNSENSHVFGSGLGLYLSRGIARLHDGDITAESAEGQGSTFTLQLPLAVPTLRRWLNRFAAAPSPEPPAHRAGVP